MNYNQGTNAGAAMQPLSWYGNGGTRGGGGGKSQKLRAIRQRPDRLQRLDPQQSRGGEDEAPSRGERDRMVINAGGDFSEPPMHSSGANPAPLRDVRDPRGGGRGRDRSERDRERDREREERDELTQHSIYSSARSSGAEMLQTIRSSLMPSLGQQQMQQPPVQSPRARSPPDEQQRGGEATRGRYRVNPYQQQPQQLAGGAPTGGSRRRSKQYQQQTSSELPQLPQLVAPQGGSLKRTVVPPPSSSAASQAQQQPQPQPTMMAHSSPSGSMHKSTAMAVSSSGHQTGAYASEEHSSAAVYSMRGLKPGNPNWINQDNFFVIENFDERDIHLYCVLDGHGELGHLVSRRCRENFQHHIRGSGLDIRRAFGAMQNDLTSCDIDVRCSGATCVLVAVYGPSEKGAGQGGLSSILAYNCGDSRAVLGRRTSAGAFVAVPITNDHKPDRPEERKRILGVGGQLGCRQVMVNQPGRGPVPVPVGPCRVWYQYRGDTLGLAMSRSLGDSIVHRSGVSAEPELIQHDIEEVDEFIIIATDGIWDVVDSNQAVQLIQNFWAANATWSAAEAASWLCKFARSRWEKMAPMIDDITCIVIRLNTFKGGGTGGYAHSHGRK